MSDETIALSQLKYGPQTNSFPRAAVVEVWVQFNLKRRVKTRHHFSMCLHSVFFLSRHIP